MMFCTSLVLGGCVSPQERDKRYDDPKLKQATRAYSLCNDAAVDRLLRSGEEAMNVAIAAVASCAKEELALGDIVRELGVGRAYFERYKQLQLRGNVARAVQRRAQ